MRKTATPAEGRGGEEREGEGRWKGAHTSGVTRVCKGACRVVSRHAMAIDGVEDLEGKGGIKSNVHKLFYQSEES